MPVFKYRSAEEVPRPGVVDRENLAARIRALWTRSFLFVRPTFSRGVERFRSIEDANAARTRATVTRVRRLRADGS